MRTQNSNFLKSRMDYLFIIINPNLDIKTKNVAIPLWICHSFDAESGQSRIENE